MRLVGGLVVLLMFAVAVHATTYGWIDRNRPNVALERALILGRQELGVDQEQFYCVGAHLSGDREGDGQNGAWTVYYASNDGARKILTVTMAAEVSLHNWNGPIDTRENSETPSNLDDIKRRISDILDSHKLGPHEFKQFGKDSVELRYKTREFSVHQLRDDGSYSENSQKMVGPTRKGICIHVSIVETPSRRGSIFMYPDPYWNRFEYNYPLKGGTKYLHVQYRYGNEFPNSVFGQLDSLFGKHIEKW